MMSSLCISDNEEEEDDCMRNNFRPPQPIGDRVIRFFSKDPIKESDIINEFKIGLFKESDKIKDSGKTEEPVVLIEPSIDQTPDLTCELSITTEPTISSTFETIDSVSISPFETIEPARGSVSPSFKIDEPESDPEPSEPDESVEYSTFEENATSIPCSEIKDNAQKKGFCPYTFMVENKTAIIATAAFAVSIPIIIRCINK